MLLSMWLVSGINLGKWLVIIYLNISSVSLSNSGITSTQAIPFSCCSLKFSFFKLENPSGRFSRGPAGPWLVCLQGACASGVWTPQVLLGPPC